jgi:SAM-dependent methyltransferase
MTVRVTRGYGLLEGYLASQRAKKADALIPTQYRGGRILDIGCGTYPLFLTGTRFSEKHAFDRHETLDRSSLEEHGIAWQEGDLENGDVLPYPDGHFDAVAMLAVFEHIEPARTVPVIREIHRVLRDGGIFVITTPAPWTQGLLVVMSRLGLVSRTEIEEHKGAYGPAQMCTTLRQASFNEERMHFGYFEYFANVWAVAVK